MVGDVDVVGALGSTVLMSVVVGVSAGLLGTGAVGLVLVLGDTGAVCGAVWANAAPDKPSAAIPMMRVRIVFSFPDPFGVGVKTH